MQIEEICLLIFKLAKKINSQQKINDHEWVKVCILEKNC